MKKGYYTGQIHLVKSHYEFTILTILQGEFDQCSSHPFHLYQKIENGKNRYVEAQSAGSCASTRRLLSSSSSLPSLAVLGGESVDIELGGDKESDGGVVVDILLHVVVLSLVLVNLD